MTKKLSLLILLSVSSMLTVHEFWIEPQKFNLKRGETLKLNFKVGDHYQGDNWNGNRSSVNNLHLYFNKIEDDLAPLLSDENSGDSLSLQFFDEGTGLICYQSFNDSTDKEYVQESVKTIFQVGSAMDDTYKTNCSLPLEFIPLQHPYHLRKGQHLKFRLLLFNEPHKSSLVKLWHKMNGKVTMEELTTDEDGIVDFTPTLNGRYMVSAIAMQRIDTSSSTNWQSYWSSLTWGY